MLLLHTPYADAPKKGNLKPGNQENNTRNPEA
jgi:hypothetical protein